MLTLPGYLGYALTVTPQWVDGIGILNTRRKPLYCGIFMRKISVHRIVGLGKAVERRAGSCIRYANLARSGSMIGIMLSGLKALYTESVMTNQTQSTTAPTVFQFNQNNDIRVIIIDNEPWFFAKDICDSLGYKNSRDAISKHCRSKVVAKRYIPELNNNFTLINEGNLYRLVIKSNMPQAEAFETWVCDEVLPAIRKTGSYSASYQKITAKQKEQISNAIQSAFYYWVLDGSHHHAYNYLRVFYNIQSIDDLPADKFNDCMAGIAILKDKNWQFGLLVDQIKKEYIKQCVEDGAPWTPTLKGKWLKHMRTNLPVRPKWLDIKSELDAKVKELAK